MKLIIDIPDHIYSMVNNTGTFGCYRFNTSKAIRQGIPLDKISTEIQMMADDEWNKQVGASKGLEEALEIIDRYREGEQE